MKQIVNTGRNISHPNRQTMLDHAKDIWQQMSDDGRGITTSEFWFSLGTILSTLAGVTFAGFPPVFAGLFLVIVCVGYTLSRGIAKRNPAPTVTVTTNDNDNGKCADPKQRGRSRSRVQRRRRTVL